MQRSQLLDILRILAIFLVFVAHFGQLFNNEWGGFFGIKNFYYVSLGGVGVSLFLILSGLLLGLSDSKKQTSYINFIVKKLRRIYPIYFICLPFSIVGYVLANWYSSNSFPDLFPNGLVIELVGSATGFYSWFGLWGGPYNPPSWFIGLIISLYLLGPLLLFGIKRQPEIFLLTLLFVSIVSRFYLGQEGVPFVKTNVLNELEGWAYRQFGFMPGRPTDWFPLCRLFEFGLGIYLGLKVPNKVWQCVKLPTSPITAFLSDLAFPLFLLHYPWLFLVNSMVDAGLPSSAGITIYMMILVVFSYGVLHIEKRVLTPKAVPRQ